MTDTDLSLSVYHQLIRNGDVSSFLGDLVQPSWNDPRPPLDSINKHSLSRPIVFRLDQPRNHMTHLCFVIRSWSDLASEASHKTRACMRGLLDRSISGQFSNWRRCAAVTSGGDELRHDEEGEGAHIWPGPQDCLWTRISLIWRCGEVYLVWNYWHRRRLQYYAE